MRWGIPTTLLAGGVGLSVGGSVMEALPASAASAGVKSGLASAGSFFPTIGTLGGASMVMGQLKDLRRVK